MNDNNDSEYKQQVSYLISCIDKHTLPRLDLVTAGKLIEEKKPRIRHVVYNKEEEKKKLLQLDEAQINSLYEEQMQREKVRREIELAKANAAKQAALERYDAWYPADKEIFKYWAIQRTWTISEGILLILRKNPKKDIIQKLLYEIKATLTSPSQKLFGTSIPPMLTHKFEEAYETAKRYIAAGDLFDPVSPLDFLKWAQERGYEIPPELLAALEEAGHRLMDWEPIAYKLKSLMDDATNRVKLVEEENKLLKKENEELKAQSPEILEEHHPLFSEELDAANIIQRMFIASKNDRFSKATSSKAIIRDLIDEFYSQFSESAKERIATVVNPNKAGGRPKES